MITLCEATLVVGVDVSTRIPALVATSAALRTIVPDPILSLWVVAEEVLLLVDVEEDALSPLLALEHRLDVPSPRSIALRILSPLRPALEHAVSTVAVISLSAEMQEVEQLPLVKSED